MTLENRIALVSGASRGIGAATARPDGYTIDLGFIGSHVLNGAFYPLQYDLLSDFAAIVPLVAGQAVLFTRKTMPAKDLSVRDESLGRAMLYSSDTTGRPKGS